MTSDAGSARLAEFLASPHPERTFLDQLRSMIVQARETPRPARGHDPLRLLLIGYSGGGNTGADVRVSEIIRQVNTIFPGGQVALGLTLVGEAVPDDIFRGAAHEQVSNYVVDFLDEASQRYDGMLACEGSMFKSKNSNIFSGMMAGALGLAEAQGKLAVGYGADAGTMDEILNPFVAELGQGPLMMCRAPESAAMLDRLGLRTAIGADTAWTFDPPPPDRARAMLQGLGWDGKAPILAICPINPFWWPVIVSPPMAQELATTGQHSDIHYGSVFFHSDSEERRAKFAHYIAGLAEAATAWQKRTGGWVLIVGMELLDRKPCDALAAVLPFAAGRLHSGERKAGEIVAALRCADLLISSRYHAIVTAMPAEVLAIGVSMDERIANLFAGFGAEARMLPVDDPQLGPRLVALTESVVRDAGAVRAATGREVARQLRGLGEMGRIFSGEACRVYPELANHAVAGGWERFLPPLSPLLTDLVTRYA
jgi:polysaccharide pyruvyl transferase WcaK-like protein